VRELHLPRVEHQTQASLDLHRAAAGSMANSPDEVWRSLVELIADDGMADGAQVHPDLMGPPGQGAHRQQRRLGESLQDTKFRDGRLSCGENLHPLASDGIAPDGALDPPLLFTEPPPHERQIELFDFSSFELLDQSQIRRVALGHEQDAASPLI
jgi:hypothetical protein